MISVMSFIIAPFKEAIEIYFLIVLESRSPRSGSDEGCLLPLPILSMFSHGGEKKEAAHWCLFLWGSHTHDLFNLIISLKPHLPIPLYWGLEFQPTYLGGTNIQSVTFLLCCPKFMSSSQEKYIHLISTVPRVSIYFNINSNV